MIVAENIAWLQVLDSLDFILIPVADESTVLY